MKYKITIEELTPRAEQPGYENRVTVYEQTMTPKEHIHQTDSEPFDLVGEVILAVNKCR